MEKDKYKTNNSKEYECLEAHLTNLGYNLEVVTKKEYEKSFVLKYTIQVNDRILEKKTYKGLTTGDIITVKEKVEGYYSGYGITPKFYLTSDIKAIIVDPETPLVWERKNGPKTFICVEFFSSITNSLERAAIFDRNNIIKV